MLYYLVDALPALLGSMATLWAVCSPRHWFVRSCFLAALLLLFLLIPAYELLVAGCVQIAVITGGITWWRKRRNAVATTAPWRVSLRNLLLFTVLAAVAMAVLASFPESPLIYWVRWTWPGFVAGCVTLFGVWLVIGTTRRFVRFTSAIAFVFVAAAVVSLGSALSWVTEAWTVWPQNLFGDLLSERVLSWMRQLFSHYLPVFAIAIGLFGAWLALFVETGWFKPFGDTRPEIVVPATKTRGHVRVAWILLTVAIAVLPVTWLVKLALPKPQPAQSTTVPAYYEDLVAAANLISDADAQSHRYYYRLSDNVLQNELSKHDRVLDMLRVAFKSDGSSYPDSEEGFRTYNLLSSLCAARWEYADRTKDKNQIVNSRMDNILLRNLLFGEIGAEYAAMLAETTQIALTDIWRLRSELDQEQRLEIVGRLSRIEVDQAPWHARVLVQRIEDENAGWESHLHVILDDWLGIERYSNERLKYHFNRTKIRPMLLDLALLSYQEANGRLPASLAELVPGILNELPTDPYADGPLKFLRTDDGYTLYSVGPNKIDDGGKGDDMTLESLMQPATP